MISGSDILPADFNTSFARTIAKWRIKDEEAILHIESIDGTTDNPVVVARHVLPDEQGILSPYVTIPLTDLELIKAYPESPSIVNLTNDKDVVYTAKYNRTTGRNRTRAALLSDIGYDFPMSLMSSMTNHDSYRAAYRLYTQEGHATLHDGLAYLRKSKLLSIALSNSVTLVYTNKKRAEILVEEYPVGYVTDTGSVVLTDRNFTWILDLPSVRNFYSSITLQEVTELTTGIIDIGDIPNGAAA